MEIVGWAAGALVIIGGVVFVLCFILDQVPVLARKATEAIKALSEPVKACRELWDAWKGKGSEPERPAKEDDKSAV